MTALAFLAWLFRLRVNVRALGVRKLDFARHWSVLGFLVPALNFVRPYQVMAEVWRASDPSVLDPFEWKSVEPPRILTLWWGTFVIAATLQLAAFGLGRTAGVIAFKSLVASGFAVAADAATGRQREPRVLLRNTPRRRPGREAPTAARRQRGLVSHRFDADTAVRPAGEGGFETRIDPGWWVVTGPNGGYVAAILLRAFALAQGDPTRAPRSLTIHYTSPPTAGAASIQTRVERRGRSLTTLSGRLLQDGSLRALALAAFSTERRGPEFAEARMPEAPPPEACPALEKRIEIHDRFEQRWAIGAAPFSGGERALAGGWIRFPEPRRLDALAVAAFVDAFPPAIFSRMRDPVLAGGVPTIDLTVHFRTPLPAPDAPPDAWVLAVFRSRLARGGFVEEDGELWTRDGSLIAQSRQLALVR